MDAVNEAQCLPIGELKDVWLWSSENSYKWCTLPLQPSTDFCYMGNSTYCHVDREDWKSSPRVIRKTAPKTLLCHDMKGGYLGDRYINGTQDPNEYRFFHWAGIDIYVYFSHHLITIPPPMWINAAHLHGVKILGTFITEWKNGEKICQEILKNPNNIKDFVKKLVNIADHYGFDGWLVNIENKVSMEVGQVEDLVSLVRQLTDEMHHANSESLVIWYDSVTNTNGKLDWQNELNSNNSDFFNCCDGIFLNYAWEEENIKTSKLNAQDRPHDVYVGIDVFGRKFYEGGGFNSHKALEVARKYDLSVAIFAPGWVYEIHGPDKFIMLEYYFWNTLRPHLFLHGPIKLPFQTSFCQGAGLKKYHHGNEISSSPWFNLSLQQYQPSTGSCPLLHCEENKVVTSLRVPGCMETHMDDAFNGGTSILLHEPYTSAETPDHIHSSRKISDIQRILVCGFFCEVKLLLSVAIKKLDENAELGILLKVKSLKGKYSSILLKEKEDTHIAVAEGARTILPIDNTQAKMLKEEYDKIDVLKIGISCDVGENWSIRNYLHGRIAAMSLMGPLELEKVLPYREITIFVGTWNMNGQAPPKELNDFLLPEVLEHVPDIVTIGTQESYPERFEWEVSLQETLGPSHVLLHSSSLGTLHLAVFVRRDLLWFCSVAEDGSMSTRPGKAFRTKGAIAIGFLLFGTSFLFVTSHLTAHTERVRDRINDIRRITTSIDLPKLLPVRHKSRDISQNFDCTFWCGDLNFRLDQPREEVMEWIVSQQFPSTEALKLPSDQLQKAISEGAVFKSFGEAAIKFPPTYKFDPGSDHFDSSSKMRTPSYTDRILYKPANRDDKKTSSVECLHYYSAHSIRTSDHKPVWSVFRASIRPGKDTIPLAAGLFNRDVYLEGIKRRAAAIHRRHGYSTVCNIQ